MVYEKDRWPLDAVCSLHAQISTHLFGGVLGLMCWMGEVWSLFGGFVGSAVFRV